MEPPPLPRMTKPSFDFIGTLFSVIVTAAGGTCLVSSYLSPLS
jgi:hypothetical protein